MADLRESGGEGGFCASVDVVDERHSGDFDAG